LIIYFKAENYQSIRTKQGLSFIAWPGKTQKIPENLIDTGDKGLFTLKSLGLFGSNGAGKSNMLQALSFMTNMVLDRKQPGTSEWSDSQEFRFDPHLKGNPSRFEVMFTAPNKKGEVCYYRYVIKALKGEIHFEELEVSSYYEGRKKKIFTRKAGDKIEMGNIFKGRVKHIIKRLTPLTLFLTQAGLEGSPQLLPAFNWFRNSVRFFNQCSTRDVSNSSLNTVRMMELDDRVHKFTERLLMAADTGIIGLSVDVVSGRSLIQHLPEGELQSLCGALKGDSNYISIYCKREGGEIRWSKEGEGTRRLFAMAGHLYTVLNNGGLMVVDELETGLHPHLAKELVKIFHRQETNPLGAQLIFTSHAAEMMDSQMMRRDQVVFVKQDKVGASIYGPLKGSGSPVTHFRKQNNSKAELMVMGE